MSALDHTLASTGPYIRRDPNATTSDDLDITVGRKRLRRISSASVATFVTKNSEDTGLATSDPPSSPTINARAPFGRRQSQSSSVAQQSTQRHNWSLSNDMSLSLNSSGYSVPSTSTSQLTQRSLEQVVSSRLFETFVTISVVEHPQPEPTPPKTRPSRPRTISGSASRLRGFSEASGSLPSSSPQLDVKASRNSPVPTLGGSLRFRSGQLRSENHRRSASTLELRSVPPQSTSASSKRITNGAIPSVPFFISSIHSPSTNPSWKDLDSAVDFASPGEELNGPTVQVTLWGRRLRQHIKTSTDSTRYTDSSVSTLKGKERQILGSANTDQDASQSSDWINTASWEVDLTHLQPLAPDVGCLGFLNESQLLNMGFLMSIVHFHFRRTPAQLSRI